jgi:hypothetical protein
VDLLMARGYGKGPRLACPECGKKGVTLRLSTSEDHWGCRYCDWYAFTSGDDRQDAEGRRALEEANPGDYEA